MGDTRPSLAKMRRYGWANVVTGFLVWGIGLAGVSMMMPVMYANCLSSEHLAQLAV